MSNVKHTPGPWLVTGTTVYALNERGVNRFFASVQDAHTDRHELEANARLIAASPDLLAALEAMLNYGNLGAYERADAMKAARAAIAKARGE